MRRRLLLSLLLATSATATASDASARTVHRCVHDGSVSLATLPEPGSDCVAFEIDDRSTLVAELASFGGPASGQLYRRRLPDGRVFHSTRPGAAGEHAVLSFAIPVPKGEPAHAGLPVFKPRPSAHAALFQAAARTYRLDDAWLRAIAQVESDFRPDAVSPKGALGVMQLMPATAKEYGVQDPFSAAQSIRAGARHLARLLRRYDGDRTLAAAAYNAGEGAVARYGGVPPYRETQQYVAKVQALSAAYAAVLEP